MKTRIDATDVRIVEELRKNARITMKELGARVFLTGQAVRNRVERLEDMGILQRYTINVNCPVFGYKVHAVIRVQLRHGPVEALKACCRREGRRTIHCYRTTGDNLYFLDMYFPDMEALDAFLAAGRLRAACGPSGSGGPGGMKAPAGGGRGRKAFCLWGPAGT